MRILIAHGRYRFAGGEEQHVQLLERGLREANVDVRLHLRGPVPNGRTERLRLAAGLAYRPSAGRDLARELERWPAEIVHFHNLMPLLTPAVLRTAKRTGAGVVLTMHNYRFACPGGTLLRKGRIHEDCLEGSSLVCGLRNPRGGRVESAAYGLALEVQRRLRLLERWVDAFVAPSAFLAEHLVRAGLPAARIHVIPHGVPLGALSARGAYAYFGGRLSREKGIETLLRAIQQVPDLRLVVAGAGPLERSVRAVVNGRVSYAGPVNRGVVERLLGGAAFAVVPSEWYENLPFAALEAFAAGVPVIASRVGGLPEIVDHGVSGLLVPPADADALAAAMHAMSSNPARAAEMGLAGRRAVAERFSLEGQTARLIELYGQLREAG